MQLALEVLRAGALVPWSDEGGLRGWADVDDALRIGGPVTRVIRWSLRGDDSRLLRARLALLLRAMLRADAGDFGRWVCPGCGEECYEAARYCYRDGTGELARPMVPHRRITPLWELAGEVRR